MGAYEILQEQGYVSTPKAADMMGMTQGGNIITKLQKMGVECIPFPTKNGDSNKNRWLCNVADIQSAIKARNILPGGDENGGKLSARCKALEERVATLEREVSELKEALGV